MKLIEQADKSVTETDQELRKYDSLLRDVATSEATLKQLEADNVAVRSQRDMDQKARVTKLHSTGALVELERGDLVTLQKSVATQKAKVLEVGHTAKSLGAELVWALAATRRSNAKKAIDALLVPERVGPINLDIAARSVVELEDITHYFSYAGQNSEADHQLEVLRQLRGNFSELRVMVEAEPNFAMPEVTEPVPVAELVPA